MKSSSPQLVDVTRGLSVKRVAVVLLPRMEIGTTEQTGPELRGPRIAATTTPITLLFSSRI
jgi:hypothetical protein